MVMSEINKPKDNFIAKYDQNKKTSNTEVAVTFNHENSSLKLSIRERRVDIVHRHLN